MPWAVIITVLAAIAVIVLIIIVAVVLSVAAIIRRAARPARARLAPQQREEGGHQHGGASNETIDDNDTAFLCGLQHGTHEGGDLETTEGGQGIERISHLGMAHQHLAQHGDLVLHTGRVQPGAGAGDAGDVHPGQAGQQQGGGRGVADAHLAQQKHVAR